MKFPGDKSSARFCIFLSSNTVQYTMADSTPKEEVKQPEAKEDLFQDISADNSFTEMESLCMNCEEQGTTRLLLTRIPYFKEIILMAFTCPHCGYKSNEVQSGGSIAEKGVHYELNVRGLQVSHAKLCLQISMHAFRISADKLLKLIVLQSRYLSFSLKYLQAHKEGL